MEPATEKLKREKYEPITWRKPSEGWNKLNVDASFLKGENRGVWELSCETIKER